MHSTRKSLLSLESAAFLMLLAFQAQAATLSVPSQYAKIQAAINAAAAGDTIVVAAGTYHESLNWNGKDLTIQGTGPDASIIDPSTGQGGPGGRCLLATNLSTASHIDGFTFQNGSSDSGAGIYSNSSSLEVTHCNFTQNTSLYDGGGMCNYNSSPTVTDCTFSGNSAISGGGLFSVLGGGPMVDNCTFRNNAVTSNGGGIYIQQVSDSQVTNCIFSANSATQSGGGMISTNSSVTVAQCAFSQNTAFIGGGLMDDSSAATVSRCTFSNNAATHSAAGMFNYLSDAAVDHCHFQGNSASVYGGGMYNDLSSLTVADCTFSKNSAGTSGGGMFNVSSSSPIITNCAFYQNVATDNGGGGISNQNCSATITNCTFHGNKAAAYVGGCMYNVSSAVILTNCTVNNNVALYTGGLYNHLSDLTVTNCILWGNSATYLNSGIYGYLSHTTVTYTDGQDYSNPTPDANGNFAADPLFVDAANGDLHLQAGSPCIDRGLDSAVSADITTDLDGNPRLVGARVDLGAYEWFLSNQAPIAHDDIVSVVKNTATPISVLANDNDPDNDTLSVQSASSAAHGQVTVNSDGTITYKPTSGYLGADTFTYTITDGQGGMSTATVYVNVALQTSVLVTNASCVGTGSVALYARLVQGTTAGKNNLIAGQPLLFLVDGVPVGTGTTDAYGKAYVNYLPVAAGSFPITVQFTGSGTYAPSQGTGTLTVTPSATEITVQPTGGQAGGGTTIQGRLARTTGNKGLAGVTVTISVDGNVVGTATTGVDGFFTCTYSIPSGATSGAHTVTASFAGNALNSPSNGSATLTVAP